MSDIFTEKPTNTDEVMTFSTLAELITNSAKRWGDRPYFGVKKNGVYEWMTYSEFDVIVRKLRTLLKQKGFGHGERIAVIANNSVEFAASAYAAYGLGGILVPMYEVQKLQDWEFIFGDSKPMIAIVANDQIREKIEGIGCESLKHIFVIHPDKERASEALMAQINAVQELTEIGEVSEDDVCDIIYTSGTTGRPRGVVLTHKSVCENTRRTGERFPISCEDRTLAFLPWAHAFGKTVELHIFPAVGAAIGLVESTRTIAQNLLEVNPTILISVPKIFNKIYDTIHLKVEGKPAARMLFQHAEKLAARANEGKLSLFGKAQNAVLDRLVAKKVRAAFGNSLRFCISGGASLSSEVASFFYNFGVYVFEGYGMTEHSPVIAVNNPELQHIGSVGRPLRGVKVEILHDNDALDKSDERCGEIVVSGVSVMKEYLNAPEATAGMLDEQGRLHTGDMGYLDDAGALWITGRVKEQYKLENGKYVVPTALEEKINNVPNINISVIFGSGKPYNIALILPSPEFVEKFRKENHLEKCSNDELASNEAFRKAISKDLQTACADFRGYEKPQKFAVILDEFTIQNGLLSPALKIRRREIEKRYADVIADLYK